MHKITFAIILLISCLASAIAGAMFTSKVFNNIIEENSEEELLQRLAYSQLLIEDLEAERLQSLRENIISDITSSIFHTHPESAYEFKYREACLIHKLIFEYRKEFAERYIPTEELEEGAQKILEMWNEKDCETKPSA